MIAIPIGTQVNQVVSHKFRLGILRLIRGFGLWTTLMEQSSTSKYVTAADALPSAGDHYGDCLPEEARLLNWFD